MVVGNRQLLVFSISVLLAAVLARYLSVIVSSTNHLQDFAYLWLAGKLWASGISPYGPDYAMLAKASADLADVAERPHAFFYPPAWSSITIPISLIPYRLATPLWTILNILAIISSQLAVFFAIRPEKRSNVALLAGLLFCFAMNGTRFNLVLGQTSIIVMLSLSIMVLGIARDSFWLRCLGTTLVMLKPNVGIVLMAPMLLYDFRAVFAAGGISLLLSIPALLTESPASMISHLAGNIASYGTYPINMPAAQTGVSTIIYVINGANISPGILSVAGGLIAFALFSCYLKIRAASDMKWFGYLWITVATAAFMVRAHMHDWILVALLVQPLLLFRMNNVVRAGCIASMLVLLKPERIAIFLNLYSQNAPANMSNFLGANLLASLAVMGVAIALLAHLFQLARAQGAFKPHIA